jgi:CRP-like cAMP-binding protein
MMNASLLHIAARLVATYPFLGADPAVLVEWLGACSERVFPPGSVIYKENSYGDEVYIVVSGRVQVTRLDPTGRRRTLTTLEAPAILAQLSLIESTLRTTTLIADGFAPVHVRVLNRSVWQQYSQAATPAGASLRRIFLSSLLNQLSRTYQSLTSIASASAAAPAAVSTGEPARKVLPVIHLDADDFEPDELTDDLTDEQKIEVLNPYKR